MEFNLEERLLEYAANIIRVVEKLPTSRSGNHIAGQLLRSGTSPYPNHGEAQAAESAKDFIHKMRICLKELRESSRWLKLIRKVSFFNDTADIDSLISETEELIRILYSSIKTARKKL